MFGAPRGGGAEDRAPQRPWREWTAPAFEVDSSGPVAAGIDGEATYLEPPLHFAIRPQVLRVRVARAHPGASPSALQPQGVWDGIRALLGLAAGRDPRASAAGPAGAPQIEPTRRDSAV